MKLLPALCLVFCAAAAQAQSQSPPPGVWRCGADGRSYGDSPCPGGQVVDVADPRSAMQVASARDVLAGDRRLADALARERHEREREALARGPGLAGIKALEKTPARPQAREQSPKEASKRPRKSKKGQRADPGAADGTWRATARVTR